MEQVESTSAKPSQASHGAGNDTTSPSSALGAELACLPQGSNSQSGFHKAGHVHRHSFAENQRHPAPPSPRTQRHPSLTQQAIQEFSNHPRGNGQFAGRDWRDITLGELADPEDVRWAELDTSVQDATMVGRTPSDVCLELS